MGFRKRFAAAIVGTAFAALAFASTATASSHNPTGEFKPFGECPLSTLEIDHCVYAVTNGGSLDLGAKTIALVNPITFQGGYVEEEEPYELQFHGAENGDTLSKTPQPVPGGLAGVTAPTSWPQFLQDWWNEGIEEGFTGVNATIEEGIALGLPVKIKLDNALLGSNCYVGSNEKPIQIDLTTGTSGALTGSPGEISFNPEFTLVTLTGFRLVNGTFAAPAAKGCGGIFSKYVDPLINSIMGLPAGTGENSLILEGVIQIANDAPVRAP
jgi:hypothetical protein